MENKPIVGKEYYATHYIINKPQVKVLNTFDDQVVIQSLDEYDKRTAVISLEDFNSSYKETYKEIYIPHLESKIKGKLEHIKRINCEIKYLREELKKLKG